MERSLRASEGFTLLELLIALALGSVILLTASDFLVNYAKFSSNVIKSEAKLMSTTLAVFEEIADRISNASMAVCGTDTDISTPSVSRPAACVNDGTCIRLRCDTLAAAGAGLYAHTPSDFSDDIVFTYWLDAGNLHKEAKTQIPPATVFADTIIATGINTLSFYRVDNTNAASAAYKNTIRILLGVGASSGPVAGTLKEYLDTTVVMRAKSLN